MRLIDADSIAYPIIDVSTHAAAFDDHNASYLQGVVDTKKVIDSLPTIDVVKRGKWRYSTYMYDNDWHCTICDYEMDNPSTYCPRCGSKNK